MGRLLINCQLERRCNWYMQLTLSNIGLLVAYALLLTAGQLAFKGVALRAASASSLRGTALNLSHDALFGLTCILYLGSMVFWIWIISRIPLSIAYPFASISILLVPLASAFVFQEPLNRRYWVGLAMLIAGLVLVMR